MALYRAVEDPNGLPGWACYIERVSPGQETIRFLFRGTKAEAEAEAARLNKLLSKRTT
jgi:hypothetical protein